MDWDKSYWSPGKLLLTSEYIVIDGATALAIPTTYGQDLKVKSTNDGIIHWISKTHEDEVWLEVSLDITDLTVLSSSDDQKGERLATILLAAKGLSSAFPDQGVWIETQLDFHQNWGLGSSSTLLCNIAKWLAIDPFELHFEVSSGSGYDIACGLSNSPLLYQVEHKDATFESIDFNPEFHYQIYFIYLNQKQYSDQEVARYSELKSELNLQEVADNFTSLTSQLIAAKTLDEFETLIEAHENLMSHLLQRETIRETQFQRYAGGVIKSLGAWGGDFVLVTAKKDNDLDYFRDKGFNTILPYSKMINS